MSSLLLTGFEPFADWEVNPTDIAAQKLDGTTLHHTQIVGRTLPLRYYEIRDSLSQLVEEFQPRALILSGQAGGGSIRLERIAINEAKTSTPYNCGSTPDGEILVQDGSPSLESSLPLTLYFDRLKEEGIPVKYSDSAGRFGCNQSFYLARNDFPDIPSGFIHVPLLPTQVEETKPSMSQATITKSLRLIAEETAIFLQNSSEL